MMRRHLLPSSTGIRGRDCGRKYSIFRACSIGAKTPIATFNLKKTNLGYYQQSLRQQHHDANNNRLLPRMSIERASRLFRTVDDEGRALTSQDLTRHCYHLATFGEKQLQLNAYAKLLSLDEILEQASKSDERFRRGCPKSILDGIPVTIKANIAVGKWWEMPNAGSRILTHGKGNATVATTHIDEIYESDIARRLLKQCGAVLIGITNMDEFGMGSLGINNGLHNTLGHDLCEGRQHKSNHSPTYNPLPWIHRISLMTSGTEPNAAGDEHFLKQIMTSTPENPHCIEDKNALENLLEEIQEWTRGCNIFEETEHEKSRNKSSTTSPLLSPGGSSSGAAVATAHGSSLLSIGTDTGGSLRLPSAWTNTVGFKPSYGTWSRYGVVSYASSLDTVGFIAGSMECAKIAWDCLQDDSGRTTEINDWNGDVCRDQTARIYHNHDDRDLQSKPRPRSESRSKPLESIRIGIPSAFSLEECPPFISRMWSVGAHHLRNVGGATLVSIPDSKVSSEWVKLSCAAYYVLACAEASSNLSRYDGVRYGLDLDLDADVNIPTFDENETNKFPELFEMNALEERISATRILGFGDEVQRRVLAGTSVLSSDRFHSHYEAAAMVRARLSRSLEAVLRSSTIEHNDERVNGGDDCEKVDVILVPTALSFPCVLNPLFEDKDSMTEGMDSTMAFANDVMTIPISLGGFPSVSVPLFPACCGEHKKIASEEEFDGGKIVGLQVFGHRGSEDIVLKVASLLDGDSHPVIS
mmetsp:Transcript_28659/g.60788  ORF Transcript_28659/g.60788 Transcript_28659/m.60788 type:complete len:754 (+) Transcript_28659:264-2525(+)